MVAVLSRHWCERQHCSTERPTSRLDCSQRPHARRYVSYENCTRLILIHMTVGKESVKLKTRVRQWRSSAVNDVDRAFGVIYNLRQLTTTLVRRRRVCGNVTAWLNIERTRSTWTQHTSAKARLTSVAIRIQIRIQFRDPDRCQNLTSCSLAHCQPSLKISCKSVRTFLHKVANKQTDNQGRKIEIKFC